MAYVEREGNLIRLEVPFREKSLAERVPGARYNGKRGFWYAPLSWVACKQLRGVFGASLHVGPDLTEWAYAELERIRIVMECREAALDPALWTDEAGFYPYQPPAIDFLREAGGAILGDDKGTGKSVMAAVALQAYPALIVCPAGMRKTWGRELAKWRPRKRVAVLGSGMSVDKRRKVLAEQPDVVVCSWGLLTKHSRLAPYGSYALKRCADCGGSPDVSETSCQVHEREFNTYGFQTVIADEAHKAKETKTAWTRALWAIGDKAQHRYALTGTPFEKSETEFWALLRFVAPHEWPSKSRFIDRYCLSSYNPFGILELEGLNPATEAEFRELIAPRFLRRPKSLVAPYLPEKVYETRSVAMSPKQRKAYRELADGMVAELESGTLAVFSPLIQGARLMQFASAYCEVDGDDVRMCEPSPKVDELMEILDELGREPVVVFSASRQLLRLAEARLEKAGVSHAVIAGGMTDDARDLSMRQYNAGEVRVLLISIGAGAEGLSLTRGRVEVFLDRSWSAIQNGQAEDRLHGVGRGDADASHLLIVDIVAEDTVEEYRQDVLDGKGDRFEALVRDRDALLAAVSHGRTTRKGKAA